LKVYQSIYRCQYQGRIHKDKCIYSSPTNSCRLVQSCMVRFLCIRWHPHNPGRRRVCKWWVLANKLRLSLFVISSRKIFFQIQARPAHSPQ